VAFHHVVIDWIFSSKHVVAKCSSKDDGGAKSGRAD
jgi:hypothetical protein